jgi:anti-sigma factor RsiW
MRCSSCEPLLDRYVEGTLTPREMVRVREHVSHCPRCASLVAELRVVDALLATTSAVELAPNFTFAVMAEVGSTPIHAVRRFPMWVALTTYVVAAWIIAMVVFITFGAHGAYLATVRAAAASLLIQSEATFSAIFRSFGSSTRLLVGGVVTILFVDALLAAGALYLYRAARARSRSPEAL